MADETTPAPNADAPKPYHDYHQKEAEKHRQLAQEDEQVALDVLNNPRYDAFFAPYQPQVRTSFVRDYVTRRHLWAQYGDFYGRHLTGQLTQFETEAYARLWDIQQKKLFDLQCQWRAELVQVPGVRFSGDFEVLSARIENCDVVPPITEAELEMYMDWVRQADYAEDVYDDWGRFDWQRYDDIKTHLDPPEDDEDHWAFSEISEWYEFHNQRTGNGQLLRLPDLRGQKEDRYLDAWRAQNKEQQEARVAAAPPAPAPDPRPAYVHGAEGRALLGEFARQFESSQLNRQRDAYEAANPPNEWEDEELDRMLDFLKELRVPVPIEAGEDWRVAVRQAAYAYRKAQLLENLPVAFEAYCQRREWGIAQPMQSDGEPRGISEMIEQGILTGRERLGEPRDFDF